MELMNSRWYSATTLFVMKIVKIRRTGSGGFIGKEQTSGSTRRGGADWAVACQTHLISRGVLAIAA